MLLTLEAKVMRNWLDNVMYKKFFFFLFAGMGAISAAVDWPFQVFGAILKERRTCETNTSAL